MREKMVNGFDKEKTGPNIDGTSKHLKIFIQQQKKN